MKKFNDDLEKLLTKIGETLSTDNSVVVKIEKGMFFARPNSLFLKSKATGNFLPILILILLIFYLIH